MKITLPIAQEFLKQSRAAFAMIDDVYKFLLPLADKRDILDQIESIFLLDDACQELQTVRLTQFLSSSKARFIFDLDEQQLVNYIELLSKIYSHALHDCVTSLQKQQKPDYKLLLRLIGRTLYYFGLQVKWNLFSFNLPTPKTWQKINGAYHLAETLKLEEKPIFIFPEDKEATTAQDLFLIVHMLGVLRHGTLTPIEIEQANQILKKYSNQIIVRQAPTRNTVFAVTLDSTEVANYYQNGPVTEMQRFWSMQVIESTINPWRAALIAGYPPIGLTIKEFQLTTMNKLIDAWQQKHTLKERAERTLVNVPTICTLGFDSIIRKLIQIETNNTEKPSNIALSPEMLAIEEKVPVPNRNIPKLKVIPIVELSSTILGHSSTGVVISLPITHQLDIELGSLIIWYTQQEEKTIVNLGIVRRLRQQNDDSILAGIEYICENPLFTTVYPVKDESTETLGPPKRPEDKPKNMQALLCQTQIKNQKKYILLTGQTTEKNDLDWRLTFKDKHFDFKMKDVLKYGANWCALDIQILSK